MPVHTFIRRSPILLLFAAAIIALGAAACSSDDDGADPTTAPATATTAAATGATGATGTAEGVAVSVSEGDLGSYLVGPDGMTLYIFTRDMPNMTNCVDNCLTIWPPLLLEDGQDVEAGDGADGTFGSIDTPSGTQVTYNEAPLYYFASDTAVGDTTGQNVGGVWFVARPDTASTAVVNVSANGEYLIGPDGMTLYLFANDTEGVSNCTGGCLAAWPALKVPENLEPTAVSDASGALDTLTREDDGTFQVTYNGLPLYYYAGDTVPGDTTGDGVGGVWSLATP